MKTYNKSTLVSVIIPCYNASHFIQKTIHSVLYQTYQTIEIIVVNDGSTDDSEHLIRAINDNRIQLITKENSGVSDARNLGFKHSKGKYILFLDADDIISNNYLYSAVQVFEQHKQIDFCTYNIQYINEKDEPISVPNKRGTYNAVQEEIAQFHPSVSACPSAYVYKRNSLEQNNIQFATNLKSPEDRHYLFQVGKYLKGTIIESSAAILSYRINQQSLSHNKTKALLLMQETFYLQTIADNLLEDRLKKLFTKKMSYQLVSTFLRLGQYKKALKYIILYIQSL